MPTAADPFHESRRIARIAGATYAALGVFALVGYYHTPLVQVDPTRLAATLASASDARFGLGVVADNLSAVLALPLAALLYRLFAPVDREQALMMSLLLVMAVPISFVFAGDYVTARAWLLGGHGADLFSPAECQALANAALQSHAHGVIAVEVFWGLWLIPFGLLVRRSGYLPRVLGLLLIVAGLAYVQHSVVSLVWPDWRLPMYERATMMARAAGEFPVILWLAVKGTTDPNATRAT